MKDLRLQSVLIATNREPKNQENQSDKPSKYFGANVFGKELMREFLPSDVYHKLTSLKERRLEVDVKTADQIASSMKAWAISKGATHYTHWFQPLNGATAEKHDAFLNYAEGTLPIEQFEGAQLIQQEPDASSFPSGGIRNTFEARGYSAWDPTSPAFVLDGTLCIPSIFIAYTGEALDFKTPLLKSINLINDVAVDICQYFDKNITRVYSTLGLEQEYFLIDEALHNARPDLLLTGRTLCGHMPAKSQQIEDHYFGAIPDRVSLFMKELEIEAWKLGIPAKTRHNEVAPNQFELAPIFEESNLAIDHNLLIMILMQKIAKKHHFKVLFHEKPFSGVNGSGKHNNWSLATNTGKNLLSPGKTPKNNLLFLTFFVNIIKAVHDHADLLRASIASAGNDHRLGAHEAPPAIISVFIGTTLSNIFKEIENKVSDRKMTPDEKTELKLNIGKIPQIILDNTDRNRTSPFAFTGNKFEFRAVGASANCAASNIVLNTILASQLIQFKDDVEKLMTKNFDKDEAIFQTLRKYIKASKKILFEGNGYSNEWAKEAEARGLSNLKNTPDALKIYLSEKTKNLFETQKIFTYRELLARQEIRLENYSKVIQIESRVLGDIAINHIIPAAIRYQNILIENVNGLRKMLNDDDFLMQTAFQRGIIKRISNHINTIDHNVHIMSLERKITNRIEDPQEKAAAYCRNILPFFDVLKYHVDKLEVLIDNKIWTLPKYRELLFL